jgi:hypothetical protein
VDVKLTKTMYLARCKACRKRAAGEVGRFSKIISE